MSNAMIGFACAVCKCPCELWGCTILDCRHPTKEEFAQAQIDFDNAEPVPFSKEQMEQMVRSIVDSKPCTCLGFCKGAQGLGVGWRCVLRGEEGKIPNHMLQDG